MDGTGNWLAFLLKTARTMSVAIALALIATVTFAQDLRIAGVEPDRRPAGAPTIETVEKTDAWRARATHGISEPLPGNVPQILADQGNWHTPFDHPGMTGPYDIRGWHAD